MRILTPLFLLLFFVWILSGCSDSGTESSRTLEVDELVKSQATLGYEVNQLVGTSDEILELTTESDFPASGELDELNSLSKLSAQAIEMMSAARDYAPGLNLRKPSGDSLYFFEDNTILGVRKALYYDDETGLARYYEVKYKFAIFRNMTYDSVEIVVDLNLTPDISSDDMLETVFREQLFEAGYFVQSIITDLEVTDFSGSEITGLKATVDSYYHSSRQLEHLKQSVVFNPDQSGTLREDFTFRDQTTAYRTVTFYPDQTGVFAKQFRDGTVVSGTFDSAEQDLQGSWSELIDFPEGRRVDRIEKEATVLITLPDSVFTASFFQAIYFTSGRIDSVLIDVETDDRAGTRTTILTVRKPNGAYGTFDVTETDAGAQLSGEWTTWDEYYILFSAEYYEDGSGYIHYEVYEPPYTPGDDPVLVADYYFSPDDSGQGMLAYNGETYQVIFEDNDQVRIIAGDRSARINIYQ